MEIARILLPYNVAESLTEAQCEELSAAQFLHPIFKEDAIAFEPVPQKETDTIQLYRPKHYIRELLVDLDLITTVKVQLECRLRLSSALEKATGIGAPAFNERVQVSVPSNSLTAIKEVKVCEDYCTELLQEWLDKGWSILAICPQPNQRRPDYIIGKQSA